MELLKRLSLPVIMVLLAIGFWSSHSLQEIAAGIALFLFGMVSLERGIQGFSGGILQRILRVATQSTPRALAFGLISTSIVQSSTLVSVLSISFLSAGLMSLSAGIGVIFGANLGSTTGAWLIAAFGLSLSLSKLAMPMLIFGVLLLFQSKPTRTAIGNALLGLGFIFMGIDYIKDGFSSVQGLDLAAFTPNGVLGTLVLTLFGIVATIILQSSHATLLIVLTALSAGHIGYDAALAIVIGANVGTTLTAIIGALGANVAGKRLAMAHVIFNVSTAVFALCTLPILVWSVEHLSVLLGIAPTNDTLKLALFHTLFSAMGILLLLPVKDRFEHLLVRLIPNKDSSIQHTQFLNASALESPLSTLAVTRSETLRLYRLSTDAIITGLGWSTTEFNRAVPLTLIANHGQPTSHYLQQQYEQQLKPIYSDIIGFISAARINAHGMDDLKLQYLWQANRSLAEALKAVKHLQKNLHLYLHSDNQDIANAYANLRLQIGEVLRLISTFSPAQDDIKNRMNIGSIIDQQVLILEHELEQSNALIEDLIRSQKISTAMATSLMNDKGYSFTACLALLNAARRLFISTKEQNEEPDSLLAIYKNEVEKTN